MRETCARVLAAALMTGAIASAVGMPAAVRHRRSGSGRGADSPAVIASALRARPGRRRPRLTRRAAGGQVGPAEPSVPQWRRLATSAQRERAARSRRRPTLAPSRQPAPKPTPRPTPSRRLSSGPHADAARAPSRRSPPHRRRPAPPPTRTAATRPAPARQGEPEDQPSLRHPVTDEPAHRQAASRSDSDKDKATTATTATATTTATTTAAAATARAATRARALALCEDRPVRQRLTQTSRPARHRAHRLGHLAPPATEAAQAGPRTSPASTGRRSPRR